MIKKLTLLGVMAFLCAKLKAKSAKQKAAYPLFIFTMLFYINTDAQQPAIKPLAVGDTVPDITFTNLINYPTKTAKLSDFNGKLVILDFWATWCGSCLHHIPEIERLQKEFSKDLKIILVNSVNTGDTKNNIEQFLNRRNAIKRPITPMVATEDTMAARLFPHRALPHYVWINGARKVVAITGPEELRVSNIKKAINDDALTVHTKRDMDKNKRLYLKEDVPNELLRHYAIFFKGKVLNLNGGGGLTFQRMNGDTYDGILYGNTPLYQIYCELASEILDDYNNDPTRFKYDLADTSGLYFTDFRNEKLSSEWDSKNVLTLELYSPSKTRKELFFKVLDELNNYADYRAEIKPLKTTCYVLKKKDSSLSEKPNKQQYNAQTSKSYYIWNLKSLIQQLRKEPLPVVDRIGSTSIQTVHLPVDIKTIEELSGALYAQDILLQKEEMTLPMLFITKK